MEEGEHKGYVSQRVDCRQLFLHEVSMAVNVAEPCHEEFTGYSGHVCRVDALDITQPRVVESMDEFA